MLDDASILSLRCFLAVVETQSFSSAARQLRLAPSTVTKHIKLLEMSLKTALVHRTTRRVSVTDAGERFYDQCLDILGRIDTAAAAITEEKQLTGHLRVTSPPSFAAAVLGPNIREFIEEYPGVSLDIMVTSAVPNLISDRIDVAIALREDNLSKLAHISLGSSPAILCASAEYVSRHGMPVIPDDLKRHVCLTSRFSERAAAWPLGRDGEWRTYQVQARVLSDNGDLLRQACINNAGIGIFYNFHVADDLNAGRLVQVMPAYEAKPLNLYAIVPHRQIIQPLAKAFIEFVRRLTTTPD